MSGCIINRKVAKYPPAVKSALNGTDKTLKLNTRRFQLHSITAETLTGKGKKIYINKSRGYTDSSYTQPKLTHAQKTLHHFLQCHHATGKRGTS